MPINGTEQPEILTVDNGIRLRRFDGECDFALRWYVDPETLYLVDGAREPYDTEKLHRMYRYLDEHGELYFIELKQDGIYVPIGDVTFWQYDMPIVIGDVPCRGQGIGRRVVNRLAERGRELGYKTLYVNEIYNYNTASARMFESVGFTRYEDTEKGGRYRLDLL